MRCISSDVKREVAPVFGFRRTAARFQKPASFAGTRATDSSSLSWRSCASRVSRLERGQKQLLGLGAVDLVEESRRQRAGWTVIGDLAGLERDRARAIFQSVFDLMQRNEHGQTIIAVHVGEQVHDAAGRGRIERGDRLVRDQQFGPLHQRTRDGRALLLAAGQFAGALERMFGDADARQRLHGHAFVGLAELTKSSAQDRQPAQQSEADVGQQRKPRHKIELLEDHADARAQAAILVEAAVPLDRLAHHFDSAGSAIAATVDRRQPGNRTNQCRLARAGCADQRDHFAAPQRQRDAVQHRHAALVRLRDISGIDHGMRCQSDTLLVRRLSRSLTTACDSQMNGLDGFQQLPIAPTKSSGQSRTTQH